VDYAALNLQFQACPLISGWFYIGSLLSTVTKLQKATIHHVCLFIGPPAMNNSTSTG